ncbi:MAG: PHP domain-containing protein [Candidatus Acidulodesulfobacterium sp.]
MNIFLFIVSTRIILILILILLILFYFRIKFFNLKIDFINRKSENRNRFKLTEINGIIHFHTVYSDGSGRIEELIKTAKELKADFLVSSDHNTLKPKFDGLEGYYDGLFYFAGEEINTEFGHFLAVGIEKEVKRGKYKEVLSEIKKQNGAGIICHPHNWWTPWKNFKVKGYDGIEIINLDSQWRGMNPLYMIAVILTYKINSFYALHFLSHKPVKTIKFWDSVQKHKNMKTGIASADAHSNVKITRKKRIKFPKYSELFSVARTHVLLYDKPSGKIGEDKKKITEAIKNGKCFFSFDMFGIPKGFYFGAESSDGKKYFSGDYINTSGIETGTGGETNFKDKVGASKNIDKNDKKNVIIFAGIDINGRKNPYKINLFRNGGKIFSSKNTDLIYEINDFSKEPKPDFYRVEIDVCFGRKKITYLYSNNIEIYG